jgi:catalase
MSKHKLLIAVIMFGLTWARIVKAEDQPIEQQLVDAMNKVFGAHPGFRANHAKGIVVEGNFKASAEAAGLSRAVLFNGSPIPATVRFSDSTRTGPPTPIRTAWLSSFICRTAATPTW